MEQEQTQQPQSQEYRGTSYNTGYLSASALQLRIDTQETLEAIENNLRGERQIIQNGNIKTVPWGKPLANDNGIQSIITIVRSVINKDTVQGNLEPEEIDRLIKDMKIDLAYQMAISCKEWGVARDNRRYIVRTIEKMAKMFLSRTKGNKERESYGMKTVQSDTQVIGKEKKGVFKSMFS